MLVESGRGATPPTVGRRIGTGEVLLGSFSPVNDGVNENDGVSTASGVELMMWSVVSRGAGVLATTLAVAKLV